MSSTVVEDLPVEVKEFQKELADLHGTLSRLSEEEAYLAAILMDHSGIDIAEFLWHDPTTPDGCFRARPYQWAWWRNNDTFQVDLSARSVGKSLSISLRGFAHIFVNPGHEMVVTAPEKIHLDPVMDLIEQRLVSTRLSKEMLPKGRAAMKHQPFLCTALNKARILGRIPQRDGKGMKGIHPLWLEVDECFPAGTLIFTRRGQVAIEAVRVGDEVLTHRGRWRPVTATFDRGVHDAVLIKGQGHPGLTCTPNHKFYGQRARHWRSGGHGWAWLEAADLKDSYWSSPVAVEPSPVPEVPLSPTNKKRPLDVLDPVFLELLGWWIAEGSASSKKGGGPLNRVWWSVTPEEGVYLQALLQKLALHSSIIPGRNSDKCVNVLVNHSQLARWLATQCGTGAKNKQIPSWVYGLSPDRRQIVLEAIIAGDGFMDSSPLYADGRWKVSTASKGLAVGLRLLAQAQGYYVSLYWNDLSKRQAVIRGRAIASDGFYQVVGNSVGQGYDEDGLRLTKVRSVTELLPQRMFDLEVAEDHSFVAEGVTVHNSQDFPDKGYSEVIETLKVGVPGAVWRNHGVTNGVGGWFYDITQGGINTAPLRETPKKTDEDWTVHRMVAMVREDWTDEERAQKIQKYGGSREAPDYLRNVLGLHGPASNVIFVLQRLMKCADDNLSSAYNQDEYFKSEIRDGDLLREGADILDFLDFPPSLARKYKNFWIGMDVGYVNDPSEILVFAEYTPSASELNIKDDQGEHKARPQDGMSRLKLVARISLHRIKEPDQVEVMLHVIDFFKPQAFCLDKTGNGLPLYQNVMERLRDAHDELRNRRSQQAMECIKGYGFSEKILVDFDDSIEIPVGATIEDQVKEAGIYRMVLEVSTDVLRTYVDTERLWLPWDKDLLSQFSGQTYCVDTETEIFTKRGWLRYSDVRTGDETLGITFTADGRPTSAWAPISAVSVFPDIPREMVYLKGKVHNSVTTHDHEWPVKWLTTSKRSFRVTSRQLGQKNYVLPLRADRLDIPLSSAWKDEFVELVAWFYTEGHYQRDTVGLSQSRKANPEKAQRIETLLTTLLGEPQINPGRGKGRRGGWTISETAQGQVTYYIKDRPLVEDLKRVVAGPDKIVSPDFLVRLTREQLELFIETSILGDGCAFTRQRLGRRDAPVRTFKQAVLGRTESFEMACALLGIATHTRFVPSQGGYLTTVLRSRFTTSRSLSSEVKIERNIVWCPTTATGTWLARRQGSVFFTGNTYSRQTRDAYGRRRIFSQGDFHCLDGARMAMLGHKQFAIEALVGAKDPDTGPVLDMVITHDMLNYG